MHKKDNVLSVLYEATHNIEDEIKKKEDLIGDLEWDLRCAKDRLEYLKVQLKDVKTHIEEIKKDSL